MNIVLAQLRKDIQSQRRPLILWVVCLLSGLIPLLIVAVLKHLEKNQAHPLDLTDTQVLVGALSYAAICMACLMVAAFGMFLLVPILVIRVVHEDILMGTTAFWLTRPVPRPQLLFAKVLYISILLLPLVLFGHAARVGDDHFWLAEMAWIAAVAALASMTPGVQAFLGRGLALLFGKIVFSAIIDRLWNNYHRPDSTFLDGPMQWFSSVGLTTGDVVHVFYLAGFSAVLVHQYLTLRKGRSLAIFIATLVIVALLQMMTNPAHDGSGGQTFEFKSSTHLGPSSVP